MEVGLPGLQLQAPASDGAKLPGGGIKVERRPSLPRPGAPPKSSLGILTVKKPVKSSQKKFLFFLNTNPLPPVSLGFLNRQSQIPFRQAASITLLSIFLLLSRFFCTVDFHEME
jgi:hypothetical protein